MKLSEIGEQGLIRLILGLIRRDPSALLPLGLDDADARAVKEGVLVFNTDFVSEGTDKLPGMSYRQLARKCVVSNVADLAAKGATAEGLLASVAAPADMNSEDLVELFRGLDEGAAEHGTHLIGGDLGEASEVVVAAFAFGHVVGKLMPRGGARSGDVVAVSGSFGWTSLAMRILLKGLVVPHPLKRRALQAAYLPRAPTREGELLSGMGTVTASTDSSDGLYWSLRYLEDASGVGFEVTRLPMDAGLLSFAESTGLDPIELAFHGGEEFHLVLTANERDWPILGSSFEEAGLTLTRIGTATSQRELTFRKGTTEVVLEEGGWEHFRRSREPQDSSSIR